MIRKVLEQSRAIFCVDCGKCAAVCPMTEMYRDFSIDMSPRGIIQRALRGEDLFSFPGIWSCVGCNSGTEVCPEGVSCRDLVRGLRQLALEKGTAAEIISCTRCGAVVTTGRVSAYIKNKLPGRSMDYLALCPDCRRQVYMERNTPD